MKELRQQIYEWKKGVRELVLYTSSNEAIKRAEELLKKNNIEYHTIPIGKTSNLFFGTPVCLDVVKKFSSENLSKLSPQEDFILGAMLGYNLRGQCERFLCRSKT